MIVLLMILLWLLFCDCLFSCSIIFLTVSPKRLVFCSGEWCFFKGFCSGKAGGGCDYGTIFLDIVNT